MKRKIILLLFMLLCLCGCNKEKKLERAPFNGTLKKENLYGKYKLSNEKLYDSGNLIYDKNTKEYEIIFEEDNLKYCKDYKCISYKYSIENNVLKIDNSSNESLYSLYNITYSEKSIILWANINGYYYNYTYDYEN